MNEDVWCVARSLSEQKKYLPHQGNHETLIHNPLNELIETILYVNLWPHFSEVFSCTIVSVCFWWLCIFAHVTLMSESRKSGWSARSQSYLLRDYLRNAPFEFWIMNWNYFRNFELWIVIFTLQVLCKRTFSSTVWWLSEKWVAAN